MGLGDPSGGLSKGLSVRILDSPPSSKLFMDKITISVSPTNTGKLSYTKYNVGQPSLSDF